MIDINDYKIIYKQNIVNITRIWILLLIFITMNFLTLLQAQTASTAQSGGSSWSFLLMMVLIFVIMWLFMIRPQQKKQKELNKWRDSLKKGDKVVTIGGIYGTVDEVKDNTALVIVDQNVKIRVEKSALQKDFTAQQ